jgi:hypothetical protein
MIMPVTMPHSTMFSEKPMSGRDAVEGTTEAADA